MRAALLHAINDMRYAAVPDPALRPGDMLVKVKAATICGTDLRILRGKKTQGVRYPSILGHEFAGVVVETGQPVAVCPAFACGTCGTCAAGAENLCRNLVAMGYEVDGAFAEYVCIPAQAVASGHVFPLPPGCPFEHAALAEPLACVINGQERAGVKAGDTVAIFGAGPIGLLHIKLARLAGAARIIVSQTSAPRREAARAAGADIVIDPAMSRIHEEADVAICAIGNPSLVNDAIHAVRLRGRINLFAGFTKGVDVQVDVNAIHYNELSVTGAFGLTRKHFKRALDLIANGQIEVSSMLTHRFGLPEIAQALSAAERGEAIKAAIVDA